MRRRIGFESFAVACGNSGHLARRRRRNARASRRLDATLGAGLAFGGVDHVVITTAGRSLGELVPRPLAKSVERQEPIHFVELATTFVGLEICHFKFHVSEVAEYFRRATQDQQLRALGIQHQRLVCREIDAFTADQGGKRDASQNDLPLIINFRPDVAVVIDIENGRRLPVVVGHVERVFLLIRIGDKVLAGDLVGIRHEIRSERAEHLRNRFDPKDSQAVLRVFVAFLTDVGPDMNESVIPRKRPDLGIGQRLRTPGIPAQPCGLPKLTTLGTIVNDFNQLNTVRILVSCAGALAIVRPIT